MAKKETVYIALGSNLGDRAEFLYRARQLLSEFITEMHCSRLYETPPWGVLEQPLFLNQVLRGDTTLPPLKLLDSLKNIEKHLGRKTTLRFGPRVIDLDILLYGERVIRSARLQVPHPRMLERAFVMLPLAELSPDLIIPGSGKSVNQVLSSLDTTGISLYPSS